MTSDPFTPVPPSERRAWALAAALLVLGVTVLVAVLSGLVGQTARRGAARADGSSDAAPPVVTLVATPTPGPASAQQASTAAAKAAIVTAAGTPQQKRALASFVRYTDTQTHISEAWMSGFYPIYAQAQSTFGVNWLLLASIHRQESAFSTAPSTYHGLNFAGCCGGPMQFNVTNGPVSTWQLVSDSYRYGKRPTAYDHPTAKHPSIYDDFDALMAAARLLYSDGATLALDGAAWGAAYDYYGHDEAGIAYADQVLARAIDWSQHGFCINCGVDPKLVAAVHAAYGAPVAEAAATAVAAKAKRGP
ncbi:MAG TPA: hypothetical protein VGY76_02250 [Solirubrobacteraceae bacterium]|jgi:hypothetical protein|nr:hypothetical protein [Solirubrobacteraceae bacterium]